MLLTILLLRKETKGPVPSYGPAVPHQLVETSVNSLLPETSFDVDFRAGCISLCSGEGPTRLFCSAEELQNPKCAWRQNCFCTAM